MDTPVLDRTLLTNLARATAHGGLTLVDPNRVRGIARGAFWAAMAGASAAEVVSTPDLDPRDKAPWAVTAASLVVASIGLWERTDAWMVNALRDRGVRHPRLLLAGASLASVAALGLLERRLGRLADDDFAPWEEGATDIGPLPGEVRGIVEALLGAVDGYDADRLQSQLGTAQGGDIGDPQAIGLAVDEDAPTTLLDSFIWPVVATFERGGTTHEVVLEIAEGRLWRLAQYVADETIDPDTHDWSWPDAAALTITPGSRTW